MTIREEFEGFFLREFGGLYTNLRMEVSGVERMLFARETGSRDGAYLIREVEFCWKTWKHQHDRLLKSRYQPL